MTNLYRPTVQIGEIWLARCFFLDKPNVYKYRPMAIIGELEKSFLAIKITSSEVHSMPNDYVLADWQIEGLLKPSIARVSQLFLVRNEDFGSRNKPLGVLSKRDFEAITKLLNDGEHTE